MWFGYFDGFVIPVRPGKRDANREMAAQAVPLFMEYSAQRIVECFGDGVPDGKVTDMKRAVAAKEGEGVVVSWIVWVFKAVRDAANATTMEDPRMQMLDDMPFDATRMIMGGFEVLLDVAR